MYLHNININRLAASALRFRDAGSERVRYILVLRLCLLAAAWLDAFGDLPHCLLTEEIAKVVEKRYDALVLFEGVRAAGHKTH